jgi:hypothetical protein
MNEEIHQMAYTQDADSNKFILFRNDGSKDVEVQSFDSEEQLVSYLDHKYMMVGSLLNYGLYIDLSKRIRNMIMDKKQTTPTK